MKILHISYQDDVPGANRAAYRLHTALQKIGLQSTFVTLNKLTDDITVIEKNRALRTYAALIIEACLERLLKRKNSPMFSFFLYTKIKLDIDFINSFDIVQLHWLGRATFDLKGLENFKGPVIWRLPDMHPFTGGCHYPGSCTQYMLGCQHCQYLRFPSSISYLFQKKHSLLRRIKNLHYVAPSRWLYECTVSALATQSAQTHHIATGVDTTKFKPINKADAISAIQQPHLLNKFVVLFGAISSTSDPRKGSAELLKALKLLKHDPSMDAFELVVFGASHDEELFQKFPNTTFLGIQNNESTMSEIYNICDVFVVPSLEENLPNTAIEALACGKPVVAFDIGGLPDIVNHKSNGYLAQPNSVKDLAEGIKWVRNNTKNEKLEDKARKQALNTCDETKISVEYKKLYTTLLSQCHNQENNNDL